jgi:uncharacterized membrane protein YjdF
VRSFVRRRSTAPDEKTLFMLEIIAIVLVVGWLLGVVSSYTLGGFIHILLAFAVILILWRVIRGRPPA